MRVEYLTITLKACFYVPRAISEFDRPLNGGSSNTLPFGPSPTGKPFSSQCTTCNPKNLNPVPPRECSISYHQTKEMSLWSDGEILDFHNGDQGAIPIGYTRTVLI